MEKTNPDIFESLDNLDNYEDIEQELTHSGNGLQYVTFYIRDEKYALDITKVREFITYTQITKMPNLPYYVKGVINLRGSIIPVVDLRIRFNLEELVYNKYTVIIIVQVETKLVGMVVDSVSDVIYIPEDQIQPPPEFATSIDMEYITGLGQHQGELIILLEGEKMLSPEELRVISTDVQIQ
jgi:purine-binding chemotaxis protein CheW